MPEQEDCIFCKIIEGKIPSYKVYEDKEFLAMLDINPVNKGHTLIIPKQHFETVLDCPEETLSNLIRLSKKISLMLKKAVKFDGFELCINNGKAAGQVVPHLHVHIIPRFFNDGLKYNWPTKKLPDNEMKKIAEKIRKVL